MDTFRKTKINRIYKKIVKIIYVFSVSDITKYNNTLMYVLMENDTVFIY